MLLFYSPRVGRARRGSGNRVCLTCAPIVFEVFLRISTSAGFAHYWLKPNLRILESACFARLFFSGAGQSVRVLAEFQLCKFVIG